MDSLPAVPWCTSGFISESLVRVDGNLKALVDSVAGNFRKSIAVKEMLVVDNLLMRDEVAISVTREQLHAQSVVREYIGLHYHVKIEVSGNEKLTEL